MFRTFRTNSNPQGPFSPSTNSSTRLDSTRLDSTSVQETIKAPSLSSVCSKASTTSNGETTNKKRMVQFTGNMYIYVWKPHKNLRIYSKKTIGLYFDGYKYILRSEICGVSNKAGGGFLGSWDTFKLLMLQKSVQPVKRYYIPLFLGPGFVHPWKDLSSETSKVSFGMLLTPPKIPWLQVKAY